MYTCRMYTYFNVIPFGYDVEDTSLEEDDAKDNDNSDEDEENVHDDDDKEDSADESSQDSFDDEDISQKGKMSKAVADRQKEEELKASKPPSPNTLIPKKAVPIKKVAATRKANKK